MQLFLILLSITCPSRLIIYSITVGLLPEPNEEDTVGSVWFPVPLVNSVTVTNRHYIIVLLFLFFCI